jgi:serine protease
MPGTACAEPNCDMTYHNGGVQHSPHVYVVFWGDWSGSTAAAAQSFLISMYQGLGMGTRDTWSAITSQYGDGKGAPAFTGSVLAGDVNDTSTPPNPVTGDDIAAEAAAAAGASGFRITDLADAQVVVASAPGTCFSDGFVGNPANCTSTASSDYCAWHSSVAASGGSLPYTNLPFQLDAQSGCGENWINAGYFGQFDGFTTVAGHEYAETVTDPFPDSGWIDLADNASGGEIGDKCAWGGLTTFDPAGDVSLASGRFAMQSLWSNAASSCVLTTSPALNVPVPALQHSLLGRPLVLVIGASANSGYPLTYAARGLPPGLSIDPNAGMIDGTPVVTAGTWHPVLTVTAGQLAHTITFGWQISSPPGALKGYAGKCADDSGGGTANGNKIDLAACTGKTPQLVTFTASGALKVVGKCVTAGKVVAFLWSCNGGAAQTWTRLANGSYVVASGKSCLTAPSAKSGVQLTLATCKNSQAQHWSLP